MAMVMMERTVGATGLPASATPSVAPTVNSVLVPRCTIKVERCKDGAKLHCCCDDELACATLQNLCKSLCDGLCSVACTQNGICLCQCNFALCRCTCECTADGVCITCCSGDAKCCAQIQACCDCIAKCLEAGCNCCVCFSGTPVCCGTC